MKPRPKSQMEREQSALGSGGDFRYLYNSAFFSSSFFIFMTQSPDRFPGSLLYV